MLRLFNTPHHDASTMAAMTRLLVIGDEQRLNEYLRNNLEAGGYEVTIADTADDGLRAIDALPPDLVLLAQPALLGVIRNHAADIPVMILASIESEDALFRQCTHGADDWIPMPVDMPALETRVLALLRRTRPPGRDGPSWVHIGDLDIHPGERRVRRGGAAVKLTPREFDLLLTLIRNRNRAVSRTDLRDAVCHHTGIDTTRTVDKHVSSLRRKICRNTRRSLIIVTEPRKAGYRLFLDAAGTG